MIEAFLHGVVAGYGIAIPLGPIALLILDTALRRGLRTGLAAGAGTATADGVYATIAGIGGAAIAGFIVPISVPLRWLSVAVLVAIAAWGLLSVRREMRTTLVPAISGGPPDPAGPHRVVSTYLRFLGLTIVNPATVVYFAALVVGLPAVSGGTAERIVFAAGAFTASVSWQSLLAVVGAVVHRRLPPSARLYTSLAGNLIVVLLALNIVRGLVG